MDDDINTLADFSAWLATAHSIVSGLKVHERSSDYLPRVWDDALSYADAFGLGAKADALGGPIRPVLYVRERNGIYDYETPFVAQRDQVSERLNKLLLHVESIYCGADLSDRDKRAIRDCVSLIDLSAVRGNSDADQQTTEAGGEMELPVVDGDDPKRVNSEAEIPPDYRDGGLMCGQPLTVDVVSRPEKYNLSGPYLSKRYRGPTLKLGRKFVYQHAAVAALSDRKSQRNDSE
jgi:hypothetical protein